MIIAEIGQAHDGSLGLAHSYIDALAATGVDAAKFQVHIAEAESSIHEPFRVKFSYQDATRYDYWQRMSFTPEQWAGLKQHCEDKGLEFLASPFSNAAVDLLEKLGVQRYKIGSGEVTNLLMLEKIARTGKPILLSSGMSSFAELDEVVAFLQARDAEIAILQCTTSYPAPAARWGLNVIPELKARYGVPVGYSDHSGTLAACIAAAALGAEIFEFHVAFDRRMFGPDASSSLTIDEISQLVRSIRQVQESLASPVDKARNEQYADLKRIFEKSLAVNRALAAGDVLSFDMLESKKPSGHGLDARRFEEVLGKRVKRDLEQWSFLNMEDLDD